MLRIDQRLRAVPAHVYVVLAVVLAGLAAAGVISAVVLWKGTPIIASPVDPRCKDWVLSCWITESGAAEADEDFSGAGLEEDGRRRGTVDVEQKYPGTRVRVEVKVTRRRGLKPGRYVLYGTVTRLDLSSRCAELTDCVFFRVATE